MNTLFDNAVQSIQLGIEDYKTDDSRRPLSAVRNYYAGILLLAKEALVRKTPNADPKIVLASRFELESDGNGGVRPKPQKSNNTINYHEIAMRFKEFGLKIDLGKLSELNKIRNDIEHNHTINPIDSIRMIISKSFPIVVQLFKILGEEPSASLGNAWTIMLEEREIYENELRACRESFKEVKWGFSPLSAIDFECPECRSDLICQNDSGNLNIQLTDSICRRCNCEIPALDLVVNALRKIFEFDSYMAEREGDRPPLGECPDCGVDSYIIFGEQTGCVWCGEALGACARCGIHLSPDSVSGDNSSFCSYCSHIMSKDD